MNQKNATTFSLCIGSLKFNTKSLGIILFAIFLLGIFAGLYSIIHINNPNLSQAVTMSLLSAFVIPALILIKGVQKAEKVSR